MLRFALLSFFVVNCAQGFVITLSFPRTRAKMRGTVDDSDGMLVHHDWGKIDSLCDIMLTAAVQADAEVAQSFSLKREKLAKNGREEKHKEASGSATVRSAPGMDDSTGFLLGMRRALLPDDYKKIFEGRNVKGLYGNHPIWGEQPVKMLEE